MSVPRRRRLVRWLVAAFVLLLLGVTGVLAWRWEAFAPRSWPEKVADLAFTDDGRTVVTLDYKRVVRLHDLSNPFDQAWGARASLELEDRGAPVPRGFDVARPLAWLNRAIARDRILVACYPLNPWAFEGGSVDLRPAGRHETDLLSGEPLKAEPFTAFAPIDASIASDVLLAEGESGQVEARKLSHPESVLWTEDRRALADVGEWRHALRGFLTGAFTPAGENVALLTSGAVVVRAARTGAVVRRIPLAEPAVWIRSDGAGQLLVLLKEPTRMARFASDGTLVGAFPLLVLEVPDSVSPEGHALLTKRYPTVEHATVSVYVRDTRTGEELGGPFPTPCALAPDGSRVALFRGGRLEIVSLP